MSKDITIVTMFYELKEAKTVDYLNYFDFWAPIDNYLVIYTEEKYKDSLYEIRKKYGREEKTKVIVIQEFRKNEPNIYNELIKLEDRTPSDLWHYSPNNRFSADYEYKELMKYWCLKDATKYCIDNMMAWLDFGYNHGGDREESYYTCKDDFFFKWCTDLNPDKIHLYSFSDLSRMHTIAALQMSSPAVLGGLSIMSSANAIILYELVKKAVKVLCLLDIFDTDSRILLLAYKLQPNNFEIHYTKEWFEPFMMATNKTYKIKKVDKKNRLNKSISILKWLILTILRKNHHQNFNKRFLQLKNNKCQYIDTDNKRFEV